MVIAAGSPARAGIDRLPVALLKPRSWFPRTRGDRPLYDPVSEYEIQVPPHARG